jgi:hypothetical protein
MTTPSPTSESKEVLEKDILKYLELKELIKNKQKEIKDLKDYLKLAETSIMSFMQTNDVPVLSFQNTDTLRIEKKKKKKGLQKTLLDEKFNNALSITESHETKEILEKLRVDLEDREISESIGLKYSK